MTRIIHLSDLHCRSKQADNVKSMAACRVALSMLQPGDAVVVTGDVTDDGNAEQYAAAYRALQPIAQAADGFMCVPGNHSYGRLGNFYDRAAAKRWVAFAKALGSDAGLRVFGDQHSRAGLFAVDSCKRTYTPFDFSRGNVGPWQRWRLRQLLDRWNDSLSPVVVLHHHPLCSEFAMRLEDASKFMGVVLGRSDLVLFGHTHEAFSLDWPAGHDVRTRLRCAPATCVDGPDAIQVYELVGRVWRDVRIEPRVVVEKGAP